MITNNAEFEAKFRAPFLIKDPITQNYTRPPLILCGPGNLDLGRRTSESLATLLCQRNDVRPGLKNILMSDLYDEPASRFPDDERKIKITPDVARRQVFIFQTPFPDQDRRLHEVYFTVDAARRAGAAEIVVVLPYYSYGRQDRKVEPRVPISASVVARILEALGVDRIITQELHAGQIQGMTLNPWDDLYASIVLIPELKEWIDLENTVVEGPDFGAEKRLMAYQRRLGARGIAFIIKARMLDEKTSNPEALAFIGKVRGRDVVVVDDEAVSLESMKNAAWAAARHGARRIVAAVSHIKDSRQNTDYPKMMENLGMLPNQFVKLLATDSINHLPEVKEHPLIKIVDTSAFWAEVIWRTAFGVALSPDLID